MTAPHPVLALIVRRVDAGSRPGARADGARLALVIEGGGMLSNLSTNELFSGYFAGIPRVTGMVSIQWVAELATVAIIALYAINTPFVLWKTYRSRR